VMDNVQDMLDVQVRNMWWNVPHTGTAGSCMCPADQCSHYSCVLDSQPGCFTCGKALCLLGDHSGLPP
jgi:hypothetical protein